MKQKKTVSKILLAMFFIMILFTRGFPAAGMEMGGFDIEVGVGEQSDFPGTGGSEENQENMTGSGEIQVQEGISAGTAVSSDASSHNTTEPPQDSSQNSQISSADTGQNVPSESTTAGQNVTAGNTTAGQDIQSGNSTTGQKISAGNPITGQGKAATGKENNAEASQKNEKKDTAVISKNTPSPHPTLSPAPVSGVSSTQKPAKKEAEKMPSPSPAPKLFFYQKKSDNEVPGKELEIYCHKEIVSDPGEKLAFLILSDSPVIILSARINEEECPWHWDNSFLVLDADTVKKNSCIEWIAVYEAGAEIRVRSDIP